MSTTARRTPPLSERRCTAFSGTRRLAHGPLLDVALAVARNERDPGRDQDRAETVLAFDDATGEQLDFDLRGSPAEIEVRLRARFPEGPASAPCEPAPTSARGPGRPRLGVVPREVTLLPRHWDWLAAQSGGASAALRRLVEEASRQPASARARLRARQERTYRFMSAMAGNFPGFEEASRALFADDRARLAHLTAAWPADVADYLERLLRDD